MLMPTSGRPSMASPASLSTAARDEGRGGDQLLFGEGAEDLFLNHLDQEDFSALAAACSPTATPTNSYSASVWASSEALPSQAAAAPLPFVGSGGAIGAVGAVGMPDPRRVSGPFSPSARLPPSNLHRSFLHHPAGGGGVGGVNGGVGRLTSPAGAAMGGGAGARLTSVSGYQATTPASGFHARAAGHHGHGGVAQTSEADLVPTLLAVGTGRGSGAVVGASTHAFMCGTRGSGLSDVVTMLTAELDRHGRKPEIDHVVSGERAVDRVKALKRCGLWYWVIVLEVEGSLAAAIATAREIRAANPTSPIIAVGSPRLLRNAESGASGAGSPRGEGHLRGEVLRYFNDFITIPVASAAVRSLATRLLLAPPENAVVAAAATSGMAAAGTAKAVYASQARHSHSESTRISRQTDLGSFRPNLQVPQASLPSPNAWGSPTGLTSPLSPYGGAWLAAHSRGHLKSYEDSRGVGESFEPRASPSSGNAESFASHKERVFGGGAEDRAAPCRLFSADFERENAEAQEREFDFVFRHGTVVLKVEEDDFGRIVPVVCSACEYATTHFGDLTGKPLQSMFDGAATNKTTAGKILQHIEEGDTDSMCSYINLKSEARWEMASFVSVRSLSRRPKREPGHQERLPPWYVLLKVCLPSTLGLIKEPELLDKMYSRTAMAVAPPGLKRGANGGKGKAAPKARSKPASKRPVKRAKASPVDEQGF
eukprot:jgi/Undpi1/4800/HiC_scaffold_19.g08153.m1